MDTEISELVTLVLGCVSLIFVVINRQQIRNVPFYKFFLFSYILLLTSWTFTVLEYFIWGDILNLLEHMGYMLSYVLLALWCWKVSFTGKGN
jgi:hypothetical protein